jgi:hypothetical protein
MTACAMTAGSWFTSSSLNCTIVLPIIVVQVFFDCDRISQV